MLLERNRRNSIRLNLQKYASHNNSKKLYKLELGKQQIKFENQKVFFENNLI